MVKKLSLASNLQMMDGKPYDNIKLMLWHRMELCKVLRKNGVIKIGNGVESSNVTINVGTQSVSNLASFLS